MVVTHELAPPDTLTDVTDGETTGKRIRRLRRELGLTQDDLARESGVSVATIYLVENDKPTKRGERSSVDDLMTALDRLRAQQQQQPGQNPTTRLVATLLEGSEPEDYRVRMLGRRKKVRYLTVVARDPDVTDEEYAEAIEELHRGRNRDTE